MTLPKKARSALLIAAFLVFGLALCAPALGSDRSQVWPTKEWRTSTPEELGMDSAALAELIDYGASHELESLLIARHGIIVAEAYYAPFRAGVKHNLYSVTKSVTGTLIAIALRDGLLDSPDHRVVDFFPDRTIANLDDAKKAMNDGGVARLRSATENVEKALHKMAEELYKSQQAAGAQQAGAAGAGAGGHGQGGSTSGGAQQGGNKPGDVIDAEYVDVDDSKKPN